MCDENKELEKKRLPVNFFGGRKEFKRQPKKSTQKEASNNEHRYSTVNKGTNSQLPSENL